MTGLDFIKGALRLIQVLAAGETPDADAANDALQMANDMLDGWSVERLAVYHFQTEALAWPGATASRTIGAGGQLNTTRPVRIESANFLDSSGLSSPIKPITAAEYQAIDFKSGQSSFPDVLFLDAAFPLATLYLFPVPGSAGTLNLTTWQPFTAMTFAGDYALPPGYNQLIRYSLAGLLAPEYGRPLRQDVKDIADKAMDRLKTLNLQVPMIESDLDDYGSGGMNILSGIQ